MPLELGDTRLRRALRPVLKPAVARVEQWRWGGRSVRERWEQVLPGELRWARRMLSDPTAGARWQSLRADFAWSEAWPPAYAGAAERFPLGTVKLLDFGAGPASSVPKKPPGRTLEVTAIDPLADRYNALLDEIGFDPPVRSRPGTGEDLMSVVEPGSFDVAHANNSVDHSYDPALVIRNMVLAVKPETGLVLLRHEQNEGVNEHYRALHQW